MAVIPEDPEELPTEALVGEGHLNFNGSSDYAFTASKLVGQTTSFSISARVRLAAQCANEQVVMSQPGTNVSRFEVRCLATPQGNRWQLVLNDVDQVGSAQTIVTDNTHAPDPSLAKGEHLAVTYNGLTGEVKLYVRGELALSAIATLTTAWNGSDGGIQIGRALTGAGAGLYNRFFSGDIDEVRIYTGVIDETTVAQLSSTTALPDL
ncbi:LamG domain-containing protein [Catellatospora coxensis]